ncbi:MAG: DUF2190 family protein [Planctomycetes bacterium]|nr:DUF2190 family protein [Planctomycetota bacterium]
MAKATGYDSLRDHKTLKLAHSAAVAPGDIIVSNNRVLIAINETAISVDNAYVYHGGVNLPKKTATAFTALIDRVYWDESANEITDVAIGNIPCGYCARDALAADTTIRIFLDQNVTNIVAVAVTVSAASATGSSSADTSLIGGTIIGILPTGNQDQFVDNVTIAGDGAVTVTLAANATADNTFNVMVQKP